MKQVVQKIIVLLALISFTCTSALIPAAKASVIDTPAYLNSRDEHSSADLRSLLTREEVRNQMIALGVDPDDAMDRIASLTNEELRQLQDNINGMPAGSSALAVLGVVLLVLIILELLGVTNVFTKL